jgi:uncharacterized repeat protein (TIGR03837 family)
MPEIRAREPSRWDLFCHVIDNYGDAGVCWRLARQLASEYGFAVRLWIDRLEVLARICPGIDAGRQAQVTEGIDVRLWTSSAPEEPPGDVVVEAFGCRLPEAFEAAMARRTPAPVWINLEYLSAQSWVEGFHAKASPHPKLPLTKYFFYPGFTNATGGLLRERELEPLRQAFLAAEAPCFWRRWGLSIPRDEGLRVSLFGYENPALPGLLAAWRDGAAPVHCLVSRSRVLPQVEAFAECALPAGASITRGQLHLHCLPFVSQSDYDRLLWACDLNFVRGEDSFVRAQWAERPLIWQIYPQAQRAHHAKLQAFLEQYCAAMSARDAPAYRRFTLAWNQAGDADITVDARLWSELWRCRSSLRQHARIWAGDLRTQDDLGARLVRFCAEKARESGAASYEREL